MGCATATPRGCACAARHGGSHTANTTRSSSEPSCRSDQRHRGGRRRRRAPFAAAKPCKRLRQSAESGERRRANKCPATMLAPPLPLPPARREADRLSGDAEVGAVAPRRFHVCRLSSASAIDLTTLRAAGNTGVGSARATAVRLHARLGDRRRVCFVAEFRGTALQRPPRQYGPATLARAASRRRRRGGGRPGQRRRAERGRGRDRRDESYEHEPDESSNRSSPRGSAGATAARPTGKAARRRAGSGSAAATATAPAPFSELRRQAPKLEAPRERPRAAASAPALRASGPAGAAKARAFRRKRRSSAVSAASSSASAGGARSRAEVHEERMKTALGRISRQEPSRPTRPAVQAPDVVVRAERSCRHCTSRLSRGCSGNSDSSGRRLASPPYLVACRPGCRIKFGSPALAAGRNSISQGTRSCAGTRSCEKGTRSCANVPFHSRIPAWPTCRRPTRDLAASDEQAHRRARPPASLIDEIEPSSPRPARPARARAARGCWTRTRHMAPWCPGCLLVGRGRRDPRDQSSVSGGTKARPYSRTSGTRARRRDGLGRVQTPAPTGARAAPRRARRS